MSEQQSILPPLDTPGVHREVQPNSAVQGSVQAQPMTGIIDPKTNKRKRPPVATKSTRRRPPPKLSTPPKKKQRTMGNDDPDGDWNPKNQDRLNDADEDFVPNTFQPPANFGFDAPAIGPFAPNGILQGGLGGPTGVVVPEEYAEGDFDFDDDECPFTEEEMNAPLIVPGVTESLEPQHDQNYNPYVYDQGFDLESQRQMYDNPGWDMDMDEYYEQMPRKARKPMKKRNKTIRNSSTVSLSALLENTDGVDPQYAKERKQFYQALEQFIKRPPDVNLLCGAPVDLYQLYTETYNRGGYDAVCQAKQWRQIFRQLPQYSSTHTSASYALKKMYRKNLLDYEQAQRNGFQQRRGY